MQYDAIIIGAGQAGPAIGTTLAKDGARVAIVEGDRLGGTCLNYGCMPTKSLRASARMAHLVRRAEAFGVKTGKVEVDFPAVMERMRKMIGGMQQSLDKGMHGQDNVAVIYEYAHFLGTEDGLHRVQAGEQVLEAPQVYINTGARAVVPPIDGLDTVPWLTNEGLLALEELPSHLVIVGGGYIGLEFGQMFRRFGSQVTIIEAGPHVAAREDDDIREAIKSLLLAEGIRLFTGHQVKSVAPGYDDQIELTLKDGEARVMVRGSHLLVATGRRPNSDKLNLDAVGVQTDERGYIVTNERFETGVPGIWAVGDVNGRGAFTHTSVQDYEIVIANRNGGDRSADERYTTYNVYIDPPLGRVGMSEREARESGRNVLMSVVPMENVSRAILESETEGLIKVLVDADSEEVLGAAVLGMQGDDVIAIFSNFMYTGASYKVMRDALPIHPTVAEFIPTILNQLRPLN